jgi:hypothetical protein
LSGLKKLRRINLKDTLISNDGLKYLEGVDLFRRSWIFTG